MKVEYEVRYFPVDIELLKKKFTIFTEATFYSYKRFVFDFNKEQKKWLRIRYDSENDITEFTIKETKDSTKIDGTFEYEFSLTGNKFDQFVEFFSLIGFDGIYQENKRLLWHVNNSQVTLDNWPGIGCVLEIEGNSEKDVEEIELMFNLDKKNRFPGDIPEIYQKVYGFSREEFLCIKKLTFDTFK